MEDEKDRKRREDTFWDYVGFCLRDIDTALRSILGADTDVPSYIEQAHPTVIKQGPRTAQEIIQHVMDKIDALAKVG